MHIKYFKADRQAFGASGSGAAFEDPETDVRPELKVGGNEPCRCGSGKKFKKCCGTPDLGTLH